jgi:hypothetical protein
MRSFGRRDNIGQGDAASSGPDVIDHVVCDDDPPVATLVSAPNHRKS